MPKNKQNTTMPMRQIQMPRPEEVEGMREIVSTLAKLRDKAEKLGVEDVPMIINAAHTMCLSLHYLQIRGELVESERAPGGSAKGLMDT